MAYQDTSLRANPARHPERIGMQARTCEPMIWLRDLRVELRRAADGRNARVKVSDADPDRSGQHRPLEGVTIDAFDHPDRRFAHSVTDAHGRAALTPPADVPSEQISLAGRTASGSETTLHIERWRSCMKRSAIARSSSATHGSKKPATFTSTIGFE